MWIVDLIITGPVTLAMKTKKRTMPSWNVVTSNDLGTDILRPAFLLDIIIRFVSLLSLTLFLQIREINRKLSAICNK